MSEELVDSAFSAGSFCLLAVSVIAWTASTPFGSVAGSVNPIRIPGSVMTLYHGLLFRSLANLLFALYPITSAEVANVPYQDTQSPFEAPSSVALTLRLALIKTSPWWTLPLISAARSFEPAEKPVTL